MKKTKSDILEEILALANFHSVTLPVEYGDGTLANEKYIDLTELELILISVLDSSKPNRSKRKKIYE